jgi:hypothetical protein
MRRARLGRDGACRVTPMTRTVNVARLAPGQDGSVPLPQCPVGTYYLPGQNVCVPYPAQGVVSVVQNVGIPNCIIPTRKPGGGEDIPGDSHRVRAANR